MTKKSKILEDMAGEFDRLLRICEPQRKNHIDENTFTSISKGLKDIREDRVTPVATFFKDWEDNEKWEEAHPTLTKFKRFWWWIRYGIKNKIQETPLKVKTFIQRGKYGIAVSDSWGLDYYLAKVIFKGVAYLKENLNGHPTELTEGQWIDVLNTIRYTFKTAKNISESELYLIKDKKERKKWQKELDKLNKEHKTGDRCMTVKEIRKYEEGWKNFQKFFFGLWD